jgi:hypothetical protein
MVRHVAHGDRNRAGYGAEDPQRSKPQIIQCHEIVHYNDRLYAAWRDAGMVILDDEGVRAMDISNPFAPVFVGHFMSPRTGAPNGRKDRHTREIVNHDEIRGYMAAMEMTFSVASPALLNGLNAGDRIQFTIDASRSAVTSIDVIESAK